MKRYWLDGWSEEEALELVVATVERTPGLSRYFVGDDGEIFADDGFLTPGLGTWFHVDVRAAGPGTNVVVTCDSPGPVEGRRPDRFLERFENTFELLLADWTGSPPESDQTLGASPTRVPLLTTSPLLLYTRVLVALLLASLGVFGLVFLGVVLP